MRVFVFVNRIQEIGFRQTTALLLAALHRKGCEVYLANVDGLSAHSVQSTLLLFADVTPVRLENREQSANTISEFTQSVDNARFHREEIGHDDLIVIRTNPGRDLERSTLHAIFLELCQVAKAKGIHVINSPEQLGFFASKAAITVLPNQFRPNMLVTNSFQSVRKFFRESEGDCVVKPLLGSRGKNVIRVSSESDVENALVQLNGTSMVVQQYIEAEEPGDKRVVVLNGELIEHDGHIAGIHRIPAQGDFRANLHAGGTAKPLKLSEDQREAALAAAAILHRVGIQFAGIDLVGDKVIEFNVFSTGGLYDANRFSGFDFAERVVDSFVS